MNCISCQNEHNSNYCPNCGEESRTQKITLASILGGAIATVTNMDKGFLHNLKSLTLAPQKFTTYYIQGKRKGILNPVSYLIISVTVYLILMSILKLPSDLVEPNDIQNSSSEVGGHATGVFLGKNLKYFWILSIVPLGLAMKLMFHKKYSFLEHLAISSFIIGHATLAGLISYTLFRIPIFADPIIYISVLLLTYCIYKVDCKKIKSALASLAALTLFILFQFFIIAAVSYFLEDL